MRVTLLGTLPPLKGISPYCLHLLEALASQGDVEADFLGFRRLYPRWLYPGGDQRMPGPAFAPAGVDVRNVLDWHNPFGWVKAALDLRSQVLHGQWWSYPLAPVFVAVLGLARRRGLHVVLTLHNVEPHESGSLRRFLNAVVLRFADHFIVHAEQNRMALEDRLGPQVAGRVSVIPMGIHSPGPVHGVTPSEARALLSIPEDHGVVLFFGHIRPYKGVDVLLRAMAGVRDEMEKVTLLVVGQPWPENGGWQPYQRLVESLGLADHVMVFPHYVAAGEVERFFAAADVVALPYVRFDAQSAAGTLALTFGRPLLVSDVGGLPDLVADPAAVVPAGDAGRLRDALLAVLSDEGLRRRLAEGSEAMARSYRWDEVARRTVAVYRRLLAPSETEVVETAGAR